MPYGPFEQIAPKSCSNLQEFVSHLKRLLKRIELNLDFEQSAICSINKYELDWSEMFFFLFAILFCTCRLCTDCSGTSEVQEQLTKCN